MACGGPGIRELASSVIGQALPLAASNGNGSAPAPEPVGPAIGEPAPQLSLKNLAGKTVKLTDFKGKDTLLLFWDPGCGFCQNIKEDIKAWEAQAADSAPQLLIVSTSDATSNMAEGFKAPVLLDDGFQTGNIYSAPGTPTAVLIDSEGRIASQVAVGGPAVLELAGAEPASAA
jgi:peroxiredoxin